MWDDEVDDDPGLLSEPVLEASRIWVRIVVVPLAWLVRVRVRRVGEARPRSAFAQFSTIQPDKPISAVQVRAIQSRAA